MPLLPRRTSNRLLLPALGVCLAGLLTVATAHPEPDDPAVRVHVCAPGPWGQLEYSRIVIEPPDEFMAADYNSEPTRWSFPGYDEARLEQLWKDAALESAQLTAVRDPRIRDKTADGSIVLRPGQALVRGLSPSARAVIYGALARLPGNLLQSEPFRFRAEMVDEWFADSGLRPEIVAEVRRLLYPRGNSLLFSDPVLVLPLLPTAAERVLLVKTLARKSTLLLKLRVRPDSDLETITDYWSTGRRRKDVRPLLQSLARHSGGMTLDVVHLLPRFARGLLYTYPDPAIPRDQAPDCHWTSMNFFNDTPDGRFDDIDYLKVVLQRDYAEIKGPPAMGDLLVLSRADGEVVHSCTYIAEDIVFTKNGQSHSNPWTLTTLPDLQAFYPEDPPLTVRAFRQKPRAAQ